MYTRAMAHPDDIALARAAKLDIIDVKGQKVSFGSIIERGTTIIVFIRHFFCGSCQAYVERLGAIPEETLATANGYVRIVVIGCGKWKSIQPYAEATQFHGSIYADPSRALYHALGMNIESLAGTPAGQQKRSYLTLGKFTNAMLSIWKGPMKNPSLIGKQGNISQLGGEFIFGPGQDCYLASRMQHTEDHMEILDLLKAACVGIW